MSAWSTDLLYPQKISSVFICYRTRPQGHSALEGLCQWKISMTPPEIMLRYDEHKGKHSSNVRENPAVDNSTAARARGKQGSVHDEMSVSTETRNLRWTICLHGNTQFTLNWLSPRKHAIYDELAVSTETCSLRWTGCLHGNMQFKLNWLSPWKHAV